VRAALDAARLTLSQCCENRFVVDAFARGCAMVNLSHCKTKISRAELCRMLPLLTPFTGLRLWNHSFTAVPEGVFELTQLTYLDLRFNKLTVLPCEFAKLVNLKALRLGWNSIDTIPPVLSRLPALESLSLRACPLRYYPSNLGSMKGKAVLTFLR
jgi:Leucine-rich repeat (LRR) protein